MNEKLLTPNEVAEMFRVKPCTILKWAHTGKLNAIKINTLYRFKETEINNILKGQDND